MARRQISILTEFRDVRELDPLTLIQDFAVVSLTCDVDTEDDGLVHHLVEVDSCTDVLGNLGLGINEKVSGDMHELDQSAQVLLDGSVVENDERSALLGADALVRIIQAGKWPNRPCGQARDGSSEDLGQPYPDGHVCRQRLPLHCQPFIASCEKSDIDD